MCACLLPLKTPTTGWDLTATRGQGTWPVGLQSLPAPNTPAQRGTRMEDHGATSEGPRHQGAGPPWPMSSEGLALSRKCRAAGRRPSRKRPGFPGSEEAETPRPRVRPLTQDRTQNLEREPARTEINRTLLHRAQKMKQPPWKTAIPHKSHHSRSTQYTPGRTENTSTQTRVPSTQASTAARLMTATRPTQPREHTRSSTRECPSTKKRGEALTLITTRRDPENMMLSESGRHRRTHRV